MVCNEVRSRKGAQFSQCINSAKSLTRTRRVRGYQFQRTQISTKYEGDNAIVINVYIKTKFSQIGKVIQNQTNENYNSLMLR